MIYYYNDRSTKALIRTDDGEQIWLDPMQGTVISLKLDAEEIPFVKVWENNQVFVGRINIDDADNLDRDPLF